MAEQEGLWGTARDEDEEQAVSAPQAHKSRREWIGKTDAVVGNELCEVCQLTETKDGAFILSFSRERNGGDGDGPMFYFWSTRMSRSQLNALIRSLKEFVRGLAGGEVAEDAGGEVAEDAGGQMPRRASVPCRMCGGTGRSNKATGVCYSCNGLGRRM